MKAADGMNGGATALSAGGQELFWLAPQVASLRQAASQARLPHALLIRDQPGCGGEWLALFAAQTRLCTAGNAPCGQCQDCRRVRARQHPDLWLVTPDEDSRQIKVDQIRALNETLSLTGHGASGSVAILDPADALNPNAANALLKTLEEPRPGVLIVLLTQAAARLAATVRSRCQRLSIVPPRREASAAWLRRSRGEGPWEAVLEVLGNAPLLALQQEPALLLRIHEETHAQLEKAIAGALDIAATADRWTRDAFELRMLCAENWVTGRLTTGLRRPGGLADMHTAAHLPAANSSMNIRVLVRFADALHELRRLAATTINKGLAVEELLWQLRAARPASRPV